MEHGLPWEADSSSASQEAPYILWTRRFITAFTTARNLSLSWGTQLQSTCSHTIDILILPTVLGPWTKEMVLNGDKNYNTDASHIKITHRNFERVQSFVYLRSLVTETNDVTEQIRKPIQSAHRGYHELIKSRLRTHETKTRLDKTPVKVRRFHTSRPSAVERKILTKIFGPIKERAECRKRCDKELYQLYRSPDVTSIRISRLRWARHVERVSNDILKRSMDCKEEGRRRIGRPKLRWIDGVLEGGNKDTRSNDLVDSCQRQGSVEIGLSGSPGPHWAVQLQMMVYVQESSRVMREAFSRGGRKWQEDRENYKIGNFMVFKNY